MASEWCMRDRSRTGLGHREWFSILGLRSDRVFPRPESPRGLRARGRHRRMSLNPGETEEFLGARCPLRPIHPGVVAIDRTNQKGAT